MTSPLTIPLAEPIEFDGALISSFTIRPPTGEDVEACRRLTGIGRRIRGLRFVARLVDISQRAFEEVEKRDEQAARAVWAFVSSHTGW